MAVDGAIRTANRRPVAEIDHFRRDAFVWLAICAGVIAWIWIGVLLQARQVGPAAGLLLAGLTLGTGLFIVQFYENRYRWAVGVFLLALIFFISYAYWLTGAEATAYTFLLVIVMAGALLAPGAAFGTAAAILLLQFVWFRVIAPMPGGGEWLAALTLHEILAALVAWRAARGLHDALQSAE